MEVFHSKSCMFGLENKKNIVEGYAEGEVTDAVIRLISKWLQSYLESISELKPQR